jgi:hypothetical protein
MIRIGIGDISKDTYYGGIMDTTLYTSSIENVLRNLKTQISTPQLHTQRR